MSRMNFYSFGNPKGTSNSEYGKFCFENSHQGPSGTQSEYILTRGQNTSWNTEQGRQNISRENRLNQNHQKPLHYASCPNNGMNQQEGANGSWYTGGGEGHDDGGNNYSVQYGQEAANAALGGQANYDEMFSSLQHSNGSQTQEGEFNSGDHQGQSDDLPKTDSATAVEHGQQQPAPEAQTMPKPKAAKWRGLPNRGAGQVKYGRHILPSHMRQNQMPQQQQQHMQNHDNYLQQQYGQGVMEMTPNIPDGNITNTMSRMSLNSKSAKPKPTPSSVNLSKRNQQKSAASANQLCGKCSKCKNLIPPDLGPSVLTFPTKSSLRKPTSRSVHNLGQDAKNFRAIRYTHQ